MKQFTAQKGLTILPQYADRIPINVSMSYINLCFLVICQLIVQGYLGMDQIGKMFDMIITKQIKMNLSVCKKVNLKP